MSHAREGEVPEVVDEPFVRMAIEWCVVLESHIKKVYSATIHDPLYSSKLLAEKIQKNLLLDGDKVRDILRHNWRGLKSTDSLVQAIQNLSKFNWVALQTIKGRGGKSEVIRVNPHLGEMDKGPSK